jgi:hypothetical protein
VCEKILEGVQVAFYENNHRLEDMKNVVKAQKLAVACCVAIACLWSLTSHSFR